MDTIGVLILVVLFLLFYFITSLVLYNIKHEEKLEEDDVAIEEIDPNYNDEKEIISNLNQDVRMLNDVVNS